MRIRQIKPTYYRDKPLWTELKADTREFYVALWGIADDAGWFEWDPASIAAEVYAFVPVNRRERDVVRHAGLLVELEPGAPHLVIHDCGHAQVPKMPQHQRVSDAKRVTTDASRHERGLCPRRPAGSRGVPQTPVPVRKEERGNGKERGKESAQARESNTSDFDVQMAANGLKGHPLTVSR